MRKSNLKAFLLMMPLPGNPAQHEHRGVILADSEETARAFAAGGADTPVTIILQEIPLFTQEAQGRRPSRLRVLPDVIISSFPGKKHRRQGVTSPLTY